MIEDYLKNHFLFIFTEESFIDFETILDKEDTLKRFPRLALWDQVTNLDLGKTYLFKMKEHQTELYDDRINFLGFQEPKEINYFNLEDQLTVYPQDWSPQNNITSAIFTLGSRIIREKRTVYDTFMMLGDVGGLDGIFGLACAALVGIFSENFMQAYIVAKLFRAPAKQSSKRPRSKAQQLEDS